METFKHDFTDEIICPYCGYQFQDSYEHGEYSDNILECGDCEKNFSFEKNISVSYSTSKHCESNNITHNWYLDFTHKYDQSCAASGLAGRTFNFYRCEICDFVKSKEVL